MHPSLCRIGLAVALVMGLTVPQLRAQPLEDKEVARDLFEASQRDLQNLQQARLEAAQAVIADYEARIKVGTLEARHYESMLASYQDLLEAKLAVARKPAEKMAALQEYWHVTKAIEIILFSEARIGRRDAAAAGQARFHRQGAEILLHKARTTLELTGAGGFPACAFQPFGAAQPLQAKEVARELFNTLDRDLRDLLQDRLHSAREFLADYESWLGGCDLTGFDDLAVMITGCKNLLEAELAVAREPAQKLAALAKFWQATKRIESLRILQALVGARSYSAAAQARFDRLGAELALLRLRKGLPAGTSVLPKEPWTEQMLRALSVGEDKAP